ncbi:NAD(P)-binding protein [Punctularia strigosozonata HHB-11173 SS5]|uniref:NAD(P)-binding protein n=1 Tax=Punctularia strigosozonata (strain HHB-11173) TaxID=741275 RepID=UPI000441688B|nr:NAD(P)-binding protein [Punctularia strigosozonata HHB-11173 SS5]EIN06058.1 NAD(P)-binding protein [Punctularia strigosozonata HHB-11173 SS5]
MSPTVYLVSGTNRGIGLGYVTALAARENVVVFAGARNPSAATELSELSAKHPKNVFVVQLDVTSKASAEAAVAAVKDKAGRLDVVISNAGISDWYGLAHEAPEEEMRKHYEVNLLGPLFLFQSSWALLKASSSTPKFIIMTTRAGSIGYGTQLPLNMIPYGTSKAASNFLARKLHFEYAEGGLIVFPICPGAVLTDLTKYAMSCEPRIRGAPYKPVDETVVQLLSIIDNATREGEGGQHLGLDTEDGRLPW